LPPRRRFAGANDDEVDEVDDDDEGFPLEEFAAFDDLTLEQLVGLRGPLHRLFEHAATLATSNALFILVAFFFPFNAGSGALQLLKVGRNFTNPPPSGGGHLRDAGAGGVGGVIGNGMAVGVVSWVGNLARRVLKLKTASAADDEEVEDFAKKLLPMSFAEFEAQMAAPPLADFATLGLGYVALLSTFVSWLLVLSLIRVLRRRTRRSSVPPDVRFFRHVLVLVKVILLLGFDLLIFPALCGWWVDLNTLSLFESSVSHRLAFHAATPVMCTAVHWVVGLVYIVNVAVVISMIREIVHPDVLAFIRDPTDPNHNPLRELVQHHLVFWHARRIVLSAIVYGSGVVLMAGLYKLNSVDPRLESGWFQP
jgi:hypothetical protein